MTDQMSLFGDCLIDAPVTEGIKYAGSKLKLLPKILELAKKPVRGQFWTGSLEQRGCLKRSPNAAIA